MNIPLDANRMSRLKQRLLAENELYLKQADGLGKEYLAELRSKAIIQYR